MAARTHAESLSQSAKNLVSWISLGTVASIAVERTLGPEACGRAIELYYLLPNWVPFVCVAAYYAMVHWHLHLRPAAAKARAAERANAPGALVGLLLTLWNMAMTGLSALFLGGVARGALRLLQTGWRAPFCDGDLHDPLLGMWYIGFGLSKLVELVDTCFLVARGRDIPFLHWYHHISVLLYCWLSCQIQCPTVPFGLANALVHSIMYYYYYCASKGVKVAFARYVTQIQLAQMAFGLVWSLSSMALVMLDSQCVPGVICRGQYMGLMNASTMVMYASYFYLFYVFYKRRYNQSTKAAKA